MVDANLRIRVERLLKGDIRIEDLTTLFLALRGRCDGREILTEMGDFVAHRDERNKGIVTQACRDYFTSLRLFLDHSSGANPVTLDDLPSNFADALYGSFRRTDNGVIKDETGLKRSAAELLLKGILKRLLKTNDNKIFLAWPTNDDVALINCLIRRTSGKAMFTDDMLFEEFSASLAMNGLLKPKERRQLRLRKNAITLYAVSHMHQCVVDLGDGTKAKLFARSNIGGDCFGIVASAPVRSFTVVGAMFQTGMNLDEACEPDLLTAVDQWEFGFELTPKGTLTQLR
jgi:hypothetical protein